MRFLNVIIVSLFIIILFCSCINAKEDKTEKNDVLINEVQTKKENPEQNRQTNSIIDPDTELRAVRRGIKYGYINENGDTIIDFKYRRAEHFSNGLAIVTLDLKHFGFIDKAGNMVIEPKFGLAESFSEGLANVDLGDKDGYINKKGEFVIEHDFAIAGSFSEGLALFSHTYQVEKFGFIDKTGKVVIEPQWDDVGAFKEGRCVVGNIKVKYADAFSPSVYGYINTKGEMVTPLKFFRASDFKDGIAKVIEWNEGPGTSYFIDTSGKQVLSDITKDKYVEQFVEGVARFRGPGSNNWGFLDKTGKIVIEPGYYDVKDFSEGLAAFQVEKFGLWGYINKEGEVVIEAKYYSAGDFFNGLANVETLPDYNEYLINKDDKIIWEYQ